MKTKTKTFTVKGNMTLFSFTKTIIPYGTKTVVLVTINKYAKPRINERIKEINADEPRDGFDTLQDIEDWINKTIMEGK